MVSRKALSFLPALLIGVFDSGQGSIHQEAVISILKNNLNCKTCEIKIYPLYDIHGKQTVGQTLDSISKAQKDKVQIWNFSWNIMSSNETQLIEKKLSSIASDSENIVISAAGSKNTIPDFEKSIWGKIPSAITIGEASARGNLHHLNTRSPLIFAIEKNSVGFKGSSFSAAAVTGQLASIMDLKNKKPSEVITGLKACKTKNSELYVLWSKIKSCLETDLK